jgi:GNAT superfamily N-acetyltransferase
MTFPVYRHMMDLRAAPRHPEQGDANPVQPVAIGVFEDETPLGVSLMELPLASKETATLLSVFVSTESRNQGCATEMLRFAEDEARRGGFAKMEAVYSTGKKSIPAFERVLEKRGWEPPAARTVSVRFTPEEAASTPWFDKFRLSEDRYEIFEWTRVTDEEREKLIRSNQEAPWVTPGLEAWRHEQYGFDEVSSLAVRYLGDIVGWVINHRVAPDVVRFTCSFIRKDLGRRGRIIPLFTESIRRLRNTNCRLCTLVTPVEYQTMVRFLERRCAQWVSFVGETRGTSKELSS